MKVAIIPARGGSKRIPRKNVLPFGGRPMIGHSIEKALESSLFDRVIVSTDDPEIADAAKQAGAEAPFVRPAKLSDDHATTVAVMAHAVEWLELQGARLSAACCIYATAPFVERDDLKKAASVFDEGSWDYVFAAASYPSTIFRSFERTPRGGLRMFFPEKFATRSQDLPQAFHDAGQFYWGKPDAWKAQRPVFSEASTAIVVPAWRVQDIDTPEDWMRAELLWKALKARA